MEVNNIDAAKGEVSYFLLTDNALSCEDLTRRVSMPSCGAVATFCGITRDNFDGKEVTELYYEAYDAMAMKEMQKIADAARAKFPDVKGVAIAHRKGIVPVTESSVVIACSSPHRVAAMDAMRYCIDTLKEMVPIWKKEIYKEGLPTWKQNQEYLQSQLFAQQPDAAAAAAPQYAGSRAQAVAFALAVIAPMALIAVRQRRGTWDP